MSLIYQQPSRAILHENKDTTQKHQQESQIFAKYFWLKTSASSIKSLLSLKCHIKVSFIKQQSDDFISRSIDIRRLLTQEAANLASSSLSQHSSIVLTNLIVNPFLIFS